MSMKYLSIDVPSHRLALAALLSVQVFIATPVLAANSNDKTKCPGSSGYSSAGTGSVPVSVPASSSGGSSGGSTGGIGGGIGSSSSSNSALEAVFENSLGCFDCTQPYSWGTNSINSGSNSWYYPDPMFPNNSNYNDAEGRCQYSSDPEIDHIGAALGFWTNDYIVDVVRKKGCAVALDGASVDVDTNGSSSGSSGGSTGSTTAGSTTASGAVGELFDVVKKFGVHNSHEDANDSTEQESFYNVHLYQNFFFTEVIGQIVDSSSGSNCGQTINYATFFSEIDSGWNNDVDNDVFTPEALLFADSLAGQMACGADCLMADLTTSFDILAWCSGCQGSMFPTSGRVPNHLGGVQASVLLTQRVLYLNARLGIYKPTHAHSGGSMSDTWHGYCQPQEYPEIMLHKSNYRYQLVYPIKQDSGVSIGGCCAPFGRSTTFMEFFKEIPYKAEDWVQTIWEKRHCIYGETI